MRKTIFGCLGAAAVAFALQFTTADVQAAFFNDCAPCDEAGFCDDSMCDPCDALGCGHSLGKWFLNGHMEAGFFANGHGQRATYDGDGGFGGRAYNPASGNTAFLQNTRLTGAQINQTYLSFGRSVDGKRGLDIGGTIDFTWGSDAHVAQSAGLEINAKDPSGWEAEIILLHSLRRMAKPPSVVGTLRLVRCMPRLQVPIISPQITFSILGLRHI